MFSPIDDLRPSKRPRPDCLGSDPSEAPFLGCIDFPDTLDSLTDGLVTGLEENDFADCMLPILFDGSPDNVAKPTHNSPSEAAIFGASRSLVPSPTVPLLLPGSASPAGRASTLVAGATSQSLPCPTLPPAPTHASSISPPQLMAQGSGPGTFIPTPAAGTRVSGSVALPRAASATGAPPGLAPPFPGISGPVDHRARAGSSQPAGPAAGPGPGQPAGLTSRASAQVLAPGRLAGSDLGSGLKPGPGLRSGSGPGPCANGGRGSPKAAARSGPAAAATTAATAAGAVVMTAGAGAGGKGSSGGGGATGAGRWSHSGLDDDEDRSSDAQKPTARPADRRPLGAMASTAMGVNGGSSHAAMSGSSLLLRVFNGAMRPDVAALAAAAAQRALVTSPSVPPGLYFTEPEQSNAPAAAVAAVTSAKAGKRGGKDRYGQAAPVPATLSPAALPLAKYYPEADAELMAALYGRKPLPRRVRVEPVTDRCHPCFRNPFEGLAGVKERKKLVSTGPLPEGALLGAYTGELRSGKLDERLVGGDLSGAEGLKAAFTLTLLDDLEIRIQDQESQTVPQAGPAASSSTATSTTTRDSLVIVGDPATCMLAEANAPRFWGACATLKPGAVGEGDRAACNCRAYKGRANNAAVIPCVLKVRLSRIRASAEAACGGVLSPDTARGLEMLRSAALTVTGGGAAAAPPPPGPGGGVATALGGARGGGVGALASSNAPGALTTGSDDVDKSMYVYGIVTVVVTSSSLREGEEVLLRWDSDESFFAVADQNLRQYLYIKAVTADRDASEAKLTEHRRQLALLRKAHRECQAAREVAVQERDEALLQKEAAERNLKEAERQRDEAIQQRNEAVRQRDEAAADVRSQRAAAAAMAAAAGPRVSRLEAQVEQLQRERDALRARLEQHQQQLQPQPHGQPLPPPPPPPPPSLQPVGSGEAALARAESSPVAGLPLSRQQGLQQHQHQHQTGRAGEQQGCDSSGGGGLAQQSPPEGALHGSPLGRKRRLDGVYDSQGGPDGYSAGEEAKRDCGSAFQGASAAAAAAAAAADQQAIAAGALQGLHKDDDDDDGDADGDPGLAVTVEVLQRYSDAKRHHDAAAAALATTLELREASQRRRLQRLEAELSERGRQVAEAQREAEAAEARAVALQREVEASRLRTVHLEQQLAACSSAGGLTTRGSVGGGR